MSTKSISIKESLIFGFNKIVENWLLTLGLFVAVFLMVFVSTTIANIVGVILVKIPLLGGLLSFIIKVILIVFNLYIGVGFLYAYIKLYREGNASFSDLFAGMSYFKPYVIVTILYGLLVGVGFLLFFVPGMFWALKYFFYQIIVVDEKKQPIEAFKRSAQLTDGAKWQLLLFLVVIYILNMLGALCFGIGVLFTVPMSVFAMLYIYNELLEQTDNAQQPA